MGGGGGPVVNTFFYMRSSTEINPYYQCAIASDGGERMS
jgi:hypothetical protein